MIFWASSETDRHSGPVVSTVRRRVEPAMNEALSKSSLAAIEAKIRYVPIVMDAEARERYPARSRMRKKQRIYVCAPQLDYDPFVGGSWNDQVRVYLDGLRECARRLPELGASKTQAQEFPDILDRLISELSEEGSPPQAESSKRSPFPHERTGLKHAMVYERGGKLYVHSSSKTTDGAWKLSAPFLAAGKEDVAEIGKSIRKCLEASRQDAPHPTSRREGFKPMLDLAGVKSADAFLKSARCVVAVMADETVTLMPIRNKGLYGEGGLLPEKRQIATGSDEALGSAALAALAEAK